MSTEERLDRLERMVQQLTDLAGLQAAEIARMKFEVEVGIQPSDLVLVKQQVSDARQLALAALSTSGRD